MEDEPKSITQWIRELIARSLAEQTQLMQRFGDLLRHAASGEIEQRRVPREYTRLFREETTRYIADLARLGISYYNSLLELNRSHSDRLFEQMSGPRTDREPASTPDAPLPQRIEMDLTAVPGEEALQSFVIENTRSETVNVSFLVSEFQSVDGTSSFRPMLQIQPERFTLRSGEERVVTVRLPLSVELFVPGHRYSATVAVGGYDDIVLALNAWAEGPPAQTT